jgi:magnesium and cobalt transporter
MKQQRASSTSNQDGGRRSLLKRIGQALIGEITDQSQLLDVLRDAEKRHVISYDAFSMIEGVMEVSSMQAREVMIPRSQMVVIERSASAEEILSIIVESAHSRFPVIGENRDDVEGIMLAKDLVSFFAGEDHHSLDIREYLRPAVFIPESKRLNVLLKEFRSKRNHIAIVVDEYGGVSGLVTIEDVLEEIVGEIEDEHDIDVESPIISHGKGVYSVQSLTDIEIFNDYFNTHFSEDEFDTIGGLVMNAFGYLPKRGEEIEMGGFNIKVVRGDRRRLHLLRLQRLDRSNV